MSFTTDHLQKFGDLRVLLENREQIRLQANGGNSILFSYPPIEESLYLEKAQELYSGRAEFIDISKLLVQFIDEEGWDSFSEYYQDFKNTPHVVFKSNDSSTPDLFDLIIEEIKKAVQDHKIPFLVRTGVLFGTGIENVNIMEDKTIMELPSPVVIFYPSKVEDDNIYFLNFKPASKYRCKLIK